MAAPTFSADRVLVTTESTGNGALVLGPAVPGFHDPTLAGLVDKRRYAFATLNAVGAQGTPTNWDRGVGQLTLKDGVWTLARSLVRRNKDGGTSAVNWGSGTKYVVIGLSADDVALLDGAGWLGLGGDPDRERAAPLDVVADPSGPLARFRAMVGAVLTDVLTVTKDGSVANLPLSVPAPTQPAHAARQLDVDGARVVSTAVSAADGGVNIQIPAAGTIFEVTASITGLAGTTTGRGLFGFLSIDGTNVVPNGSYANEVELIYGNAYAVAQEVGANSVPFSTVYDLPDASCALTCKIFLGTNGVTHLSWECCHVRDGSTRAIRRGWTVINGGRLRYLRFIDSTGQGLRAGSIFSLRRLA